MSRGCSLVFGLVIASFCGIWLQRVMRLVGMEHRAAGGEVLELQLIDVAGAELGQRERGAFGVGRERDWRRFFRRGGRDRGRRRRASIRGGRTEIE